MRWFNPVDVKKAQRLNGCSWMALTKLDILDTLREIKVAIGYDEEPVYEKFDGWQASTGKIREWGELPEKARRYVERLEELCDLPIRLISVGPTRDAIIKRP